MPGRPRKPAPPRVGRMLSPRRPGTVAVQALLDPTEIKSLDAIVELMRDRGFTASRSQALRWALIELDARLDLARMARGAMPAFTPPGPIAPPPD